MTSRTNALLARLPDCEAALISSDANRFYFLGLDTGDAGTVLIMHDKTYFIIDSRYIEIARREIKDAELILEKKRDEQIGNILRSHGVATLYVETSSTLAQIAELRRDLEGVELDCTAKLTTAINAIRSIKSEQEIANMRLAQEVTDRCFTHILPFIKPGVREIDIALEMEMFMRSKGADGIAFNTILVAGQKTSLPHGEPDGNVIVDGGFVTMDFGAKVKGYCTDMTRTVAVGSVTDEMRKVYDTVAAAQMAAIQRAKGGMRGCDVDKISRDIIYEAGYEGCFGHGLGHSLGIEIHENPRYSPMCEDMVRTGMMMTIEPGVYLAGKFGVRIEDTVIVKANEVEVLGSSDKSLIIL